MMLFSRPSPSFRRHGSCYRQGLAAHRDDPLADLLLTSADYVDLTHRVLSICPGGE